MESSFKEIDAISSEGAFVNVFNTRVKSRVGNQCIGGGLIKLTSLKNIFTWGCVEICTFPDTPNTACKAATCLRRVLQLKPLSILQEPQNLTNSWILRI